MTDDIHKTPYNAPGITYWDAMGREVADPAAARSIYNPQTDTSRTLFWWERQKLMDICEPQTHTKANFEAAKVWMIRRHAFYGSFLVSLNQEWSWKVPMAGTDGSSIFYNPRATENLDQHQWRFLMAHEVMHVAHLHSFRGGNRLRTKGPNPITPREKKQHQLWNIATDITINELILSERGFKEIEGLCLPVDDPNTGQQWAKYSGQTPEWIYEDLWKNVKHVYVQGGQSSTNSAGSNGCGDDGNSHARVDAKGGNPKDAPGQGAQLDDSGALDPDKLGDRGQAGTQPGQEVRHVKVDWLHGDVLPPCDLSEAERNAAKQKASHMAATAAYHARAMGQDSEIVKQVLDGQKAPNSWQTRLRDFVASVVDKDDYSWAKPNRRLIPSGIYFPTLAGTKPPKLMALVVDISVSISIDQLDKMVEEIASCIQNHPHLSFETFFVNTELTRQIRIGAEDLPLDLNVTGNGGTCFRPAFEAIEDQGLEVSGLVYFTDLECRTYAPEPEFPVIWLNFDHPIQKGDYGHPPYGEVVNMI
jgi:predicted metal-dependent peptidase